MGFPDVGRGDVEGVQRPQPTPKEDLDWALETLRSHRDEWVALPIAERRGLVRQVIRDFRRVQHQWVEYSVRAKGIAERSIGNDFEWLEIAAINRAHFVVHRSLRDIERRSRPVIPGGYTTLPNGQVVAHTYPDSRSHGMLFQGITEEVWLEPGVTLDEAVRSQAREYNGDVTQGKVALVLGAGNASSLLTSDVFHKMFHDLRVVILKMNPINSYLGPLIERAYGGLVQGGFLRVVHGGPEVGRYLVDHPLVDEVHMTGSDRTFEAVVFGPGEDGARRKSEGAPLVQKPVTGELGCITPWLIVPGDWSREDVRQQAARMAYWMMRHEGYICYAPRALVLWSGWNLRGAFVESLIDALSYVEPILAYYPGSLETQRAFVAAHPDAVQVGGEREGHVPWTVIRNIDPENADDICFRRESFSGLVVEVALGASSVHDYIDAAVAFLNGTVWGTLSATIVVSPESLADPTTSEAVERAIMDLRYGTVAVNVPGTWGFYTMVTPWGAFPGSDLQDIQSGLGKTTNFLMLHRPQKSVVRAPFRLRPYPFYGTAPDLHKFSRRLARFEESHSWFQLLGLYMSARRSDRPYM